MVLKIKAKTHAGNGHEVLKKFGLRCCGKATHSGAFYRAHVDLILACSTGQNVKKKKELLMCSLILRFAISLHFTKKKEVFMTSTDYSWKPSVGIA